MFYIFKDLQNDLLAFNYSHVSMLSQCWFAHCWEDRLQVSVFALICVKNKKSFFSPDVSFFPIDASAVLKDIQTTDTHVGLLSALVDATWLLARRTDM